MESSKLRGVQTLALASGNIKSSAGVFYFLSRTPLTTVMDTRRGSRISARGGRQGIDGLIWDGDERFLTYANTDLQLFKIFIAILCLNGVLIRGTPVSLLSALETKEPSPPARVPPSQGWAPDPAPPPRIRAWIPLEVFIAVLFLGHPAP